MTLFSSQKCFQSLWNSYGSTNMLPIFIGGFWVRYETNNIGGLWEARKMLLLSKNLLALSMINEPLTIPPLLNVFLLIANICCIMWKLVFALSGIRKPFEYLMCHQLQGGSRVVSLWSESNYELEEIKKDTVCKKVVLW